MTRTRLIVWNCVILTLLLAAIGAAIYFFTRQSMLNAVDAGLKARANFLTRTWRGPMDAERLARARERLPQAISTMSGGEPMSPDEIRALQIQRLTAQTIYFDLSGIGIVDTSERPRSPAGFEAAKKGQLVLSNSRLGKEPARTIDVPLRKNGHVLEVAEFTASLAPVYAELARLERTLLLVLPLAVLVMMATGVILTRRALAPVTQISHTASRIGATNLEERLPVTGNDEFGELSKTFNTMLDRITEAFKTQEKAYQMQKAFTADASHELKTPLTAIRTRAEIALRKDMQPAKYKEHFQAIDRAAKAMSHLVQDLLLLATSDEGRAKLAYESTRVCDLVEDAMGSVDPQNRNIEVDVPEQLAVMGNRGALTRVLTNLLDNAVRHTADQGTIRFSASSLDSKITVTVADDGEGIPKEDLPLIFDRFHRVDRSRNRDSGGTGLGLAIAKAITETHGGTIHVDSEPHKGTTVTLTFPAVGSTRVS